MQGEDDSWPYGLGFAEAPAHFQSQTQIARVQTEEWAARALYCPNCGADGFERFGNNAPVADLRCRDCPEQYELKSTKRRFGRKVVDGAYSTMRERLIASDNPNLLLLAYDPDTRRATDVIVVPKQFLVLDIIEKRKPLASSARRAGWVGCNILLDHVPSAGRIPLLKASERAPKTQVLSQWRQTLFLRQSSQDARGWLLEVMKAVEEVGRREFTLDEVYAAEPRLQALYPLNRNVRPKIRQQLQVLRDHGFLEFAGRGIYRLRGQVSV